MKTPLWRRRQASPFLLAAAFWGLSLPAVAADLLRRDLPAADYDEVRQTLVEAIEGEGLVVGPVSRFGDMLQRTDRSLRHGGDIYARAEIFSFCSVAIAARLVREDPDRIADCPLSIALYRLRGGNEVVLVYRPHRAETANALLERIVERTAAWFR